MFCFDLWILDLIVIIRFAVVRVTDLDFIFRDGAMNATQIGQKKARLVIQKRSKRFVTAQIDSAIMSIHVSLSTISIAQCEEK